MSKLRFALSLLASLYVLKADIITFGAPAFAPTINSTFTVSLSVSLGATEQIGDYDLTVNFNPGVLQTTSVAFGSFLGGPGNSIQQSVLSTGRTELAEVSLLSPGDLAALQPTSFALGTITFRAIGEGSTSLTFMPLEIDDVNGIPLTISGVSSTVDVVPEPSAMALMMLVLCVVISSRELGFAVPGLTGAGRALRKRRWFANFLR